MKVYVLINIYNLPDDSDNEIVGVYETYEKAKQMAFHIVTNWRVDFDGNEDIIDFKQSDDTWIFESIKNENHRVFVQIVEKELRKKLQNG